MIKAIETIYQGYRFRSRLEARWAVFFDKAGIEYQYEPEGYQLSDGTYYLPDFYLPWFRCYVEIKPEGLEQKKLREAKDKCIRLFEDLEDKITMLCIGDPMNQDMRIFCNDTNDSGGGLCSDGWRCYFSDFSVFPHLLISAKADRSFYSADWKPLQSVSVYDERFFHPFNDAMLAARQARFEHGE